jgi:hypothetical protein
MTADWEDDVQERVAELGQPIAEFCVDSRRLLRNLLVAPLWILLGGVLIVVVAILPLVKGGHVHGHHFVLLGVPLAWRGVVIVTRVFKNRGLRLLFYPEGMIRVQGEVEQAIFWEEVQTASRKTTALAHIPMSRSITLTRLTGKEMSFDDSIPRFKQLCDLLESQTLPHLLPRARQAYEEGKTLEFGKVRLSVGGISHEKRTVRWRDIKRLSFESDALSVYEQGKWGRAFEVKANDIPNFHVVRALVQSVLAMRQTGRTGKPVTES